MSEDRVITRKAINFDLSTNTLEELFGKGNTKKPYADIKNLWNRMVLCTDNIQAMCQWSQRLKPILEIGKAAKRTKRVARACVTFWGIYYTILVSCLQISYIFGI